MRRLLLAVSIAALLFSSSGSMAQGTDSAAPGQGTPAVIATPPSVDNGVANGKVKAAGSPSVSNGVSNGIVKPPGAPSVGDGVANGVVKSTTVQQ